MAVRGTTSYVYFTDRSLGVGATGNVYFGRHKRRGDPCAIKVFRSSDGGQREMQMRQREFNVMSKLNHENIVKFIAIESESHGNDRVLIMELCTGGSVYKMLEDPENAYGFPEDELIIFLRDITKALQYLRQNGIVHRDIKPGNILRCINDDLSSVYKLTDFGAARELPEDGEFVSLYGTEEYLHPDLYAKALLGTNRFMPSKPFNASVDLWSLGVTLYHVATGRLPFQPFGGRKNKEAMHMIISKKEPGFVSGVQHTKDGSIEWSKEFPKTCALSWGLKQLLLPILVGLLESERRRQWNFDTFFHASENITSRTLIHVFCVSSCSHNRLYIGREERKSLTHFQEYLAEVTKIPSSRQLLFHERWQVENLILSAESEPNDVIQRTSIECPLYVLPSSYSSADWSMETYDLPKLPVLPVGGDLVEDSNFARNTCAFVMLIHEKTKCLSYSQDSLAICASHLGKLLSSSLQEQQFLQHSLLPSYDKLSKLKSNGSTWFNKIELLWNQMKLNFEKVENNITKFYQDSLFRSYSIIEFLKKYSTKICHPSSSCTKKQTRLVKELETIKNTFREHKKKELSYNEQQIHKFEKGRISDGAKRSLELYNSHCSVNTEAAWKAFQSFHSVYSKQKGEIEQTDALLRTLHEQMTHIEERLFEILMQQSSDTEKNPNMKLDNAALHDTRYGQQPTTVYGTTGDDSALITSFKTTSVTPAGLGGSSAESHLIDDVVHLRSRELQSQSGVLKETISEEFSVDSGIEMMSGKLKKILRDTDEHLKITISRSDENEALLSQLIILSTP